ncbi:hypothetical protein [Streptomyces sp. ODS28]|uniref:hypothetical protein n=1 Tax=Streptomyces sp. ODS28 TaxID=3136688 RepID=UPI0031E54D68
MSVFAVLFTTTLLLFSAAVVIYLRVGFTQRRAPIPLTALAAWAAWDGMQVFGFMRPYDALYYFEPGFVLVEGLLLYLCFAHRARHCPGVPVAGLAAYALVVIVVSCAGIAALGRALGDPQGVVSQALVAVPFPALIVLRRTGALRPGQHPVAAVLFALASAAAFAAMVIDPPPGSRPGLNALAYGVLLLFSAASAWVVLSARRGPIAAQHSRPRPARRSRPCSPPDEAA